MTFVHRTIAGLLLVLTVAWGTAAQAQIDGGGRTALQNVAGGVVRVRSPGKLVIAGVARAQQAITPGFVGVTITETSRPTEPRALFLVDAIEAIFSQLNQLIIFFEDLLLARAGLPSRLSASLFSSQGLLSGSVGPSE